MKNQSVILNFALAIVIVVLSFRLISAFDAGTKQTKEDDKTVLPTEGKEVGDGFVTFDVMKDFNENPFTFFTGHGLLLCAGDKEGANAMTIGWGALGTLWSKPSMTVYVRHGRYTHQFMERGRYFTVMKFDDNKVVDYMGTHSGRDGDKAKALGLTLAYTKNGAPYYKEASIVIECRLMSANDFTEKCFRDDVPREIYSNTNDDGGMHTEYVGEVVSAVKKK